MRRLVFCSAAFFLLSICFQNSLGQSIALKKGLEGFDDYVESVMKDWNSVGVAIGIVHKDQLVFAKGYGYRDLEKQLPITPNTLFPIASNTKLFTAVTMGMLVEEGKMAWDLPISKYVPEIEFYNDDLYNTVTLRDMLAHRTGISRHDLIWYKSDFKRKELFDRLIYLEPAQPIRQSSLYNNLMYTAAGFSLELLEQKTWEDFTQTRILNPLGMVSTIFTIEEMEKQQDFAFPYYEQRDTDKIQKRPFYREQVGIAPAGAIISNLEDMSKWLITLMNSGDYNGENIISPEILKETLRPAIAYPNSQLENKGYKEILNPAYGMGRGLSVFKGHFYTSHGGSIGGFYSQVSMMHYDSLGVVVFVNSAHNYPLVNLFSYEIYDRLLSLEPTDWNGRLLKNYLESKKLVKEARAKAGSDKIPNTAPSHPVSDYVGIFENPAYGTVNITLENEQLQFDFHNIKLPLRHFHFDRFDTPDNEIYGKWSVNFSINPQGEIHSALISLDESEVAFTRKPDESLSDPELLAKYSGEYEVPGAVISVLLNNENQLILNIPGQPKYTLVPYKERIFTMKKFSDISVEFTLENGSVTTMELIQPSGNFECKRKAPPIQ